jgi:hypothetical protein
MIRSKFEYADIVRYQILNDEKLTRDGLEEYGRWREVVNAVERRENVRKWLGSERYRG